MVNWTEDEAKKILGDKYTPPPKRANIFPTDGKPEPVTFHFKKPDDGMNATERRYADHVLDPLKFSKEILEWFFESVTFNLAPKTTYTPDFFIIRYDSVHIVEIKGELQDDASVKFKVAREAFPWFRWEMLRWDRDDFIRVRI